MKDILDFRFLSYPTALPHHGLEDVTKPLPLFRCNISVHWELQVNYGPFPQMDNVLVWGHPSRMAAVGFYPMSLPGQFCEEIYVCFCLFVCFKITSSLCSSSFTEHHWDVRHHEEEGSRNLLLMRESHKYRDKDRKLWWVLEGNGSSLMVPLPLQILHLPSQTKVYYSFMFLGLCRGLSPWNKVIFTDFLDTSIFPLKFLLAYQHFS